MSEEKETYNKAYLSWLAPLLILIFKDIISTLHYPKDYAKIILIIFFLILGIGIIINWVYFIKSIIRIKTHKSVLRHVLCGIPLQLFLALYIIFTTSLFLNRDTWKQRYEEENAIYESRRLESQQNSSND